MVDGFGYGLFVGLAGFRVWLWFVGGGVGLIGFRFNQWVVVGLSLNE